MKIKQKVTYSIQFNRVKIYIDNILHISLPYNNNIKIQSWYENKGRYMIEIYASKNLDQYGYNNRELWVQVLEALDKVF